MTPAGTPPTPRGEHSIVYDANSNSVIVFGGMDGGTQNPYFFFNETWVLTNANGTGGSSEWRRLDPQGALPQGRGFYTAGYAGASNRLVVTMGRNDRAPAPGQFNDVWVLANANGRCTAGQPCNYDVDATDPDVGDTLTFSLDTSLAGMTINPSTGLIEWTPTPAQIGDHSVTVRVRDASGLSAAQTFTLTVAPVAVPNVVGLAPEWAEALIGAADLTVGTETHTGGDVTLRFDSLPSAQGWTYFPFGNSAPEATVFSINGTALFQNSLNVGFSGRGSNRYNFFTDLSPRLPFTLSARSRVLEENGDFTTNSFGFGFGPLAKTYAIEVGLGTKRITDVAGRIFSTQIDNSQFYNYRLEGSLGIGYRLFVDDVLLGADPASQTGNDQSQSFLFVGDNTGGTNARAEVTAYSFLQPRVTAQNPPAGTLVRNKSAVDLTIQDGPATQPVPNLVGLTQADATVAIVTANLTVGSVTNSPSPAPVGTVISQTPLAGIKVVPGTIVNLVMSSGGGVNHPPSITSTAPTTATTGQPYSYDVDATDPDAEDVLTYSLPVAPTGMTINTTTGLIQWTPTTGQAGSQNVTVRVQDAGGLFVEQNFIISVASVPVTIAVPNVVGLVQAAAQTAITTVNLTIGIITTANSNTVPAGNIISQTPAAGALVAPQTAVNLTVSLGPVPVTVTVPSVIGQTQTAAQATLIGAKLTLGTVSTVDSDHALSFTTLPSTQGWLYVPFGNTATETQVFSLNSGVLQQNTLGLVDGFNFYQLSGVVQPTLPFALTVTARVLAQEGDATDAFGFGFAVVVGTQQFAFGLRTGSIHDPVGNMLSTTIDTTQFHEYRLEGTPGGGYKLFVDGIFLGSGSAGTRATAAQFVSFGDLSDTANARGEIRSLAFVQSVGTVTAQQPAAGSSVAEGTAVNITIIKTPASVTVPNVVNQSQAAATTALIAAKLLVGTMTTANSETVPAGNIISQTPTAGTSVAEHTAVALVVSLGSTQVTVPNIVGLTQTAATTALTTAKLKVGTVTSANSSTVPVGQILSQNPTAGTKVAPDSAVAFVLSLGPVPPPPPPPPSGLISILVQPKSPLLLTSQTQAFTATGILNDGSSQSLTGQVTWASSNPSVATIAASGVASGSRGRDNDDQCHQWQHHRVYYAHRESRSGRWDSSDCCDYYARQ